MESESGARAAGEGTGVDVVVGLGANVGAAEQVLRGAVFALSRWGRRVGVSRLYRSLPVGGPPQPDFLNAALRLRCQGGVRALLAELQRLERLAGRERRERWGPRTLDLDILWGPGLELSEPDLSVPHPRLRERAFALQPLLDVAPEARDPRDGVAYARVLAELGSSGIVALDTGWPELAREP